MVVTRVVRTDRIFGMRCQAGCGKTIKAGQVVITHTVGGLSWDKNLIAAHASCLRALLTKVPEEWTEFDEVKARLQAGGPLFA